MLPYVLSIVAQVAGARRAANPQARVGPRRKGAR
jgi:ABC-type uncharacterized transport system permease subunit